MKVKSLLYAICTFLLFFSATAVASTASVTGYSGSDALQTVMGIIYGPWGLLIGLVLFVAAIFAWLRLGAGAGITVAVFSIIIFIAPAVIAKAQQWGASHAGYTQNTKP